MAKTKALFSFASLFSVAALQGSFDEAVTNDAKNGRINAQLVALALATDGIDIPLHKANKGKTLGFDAFSVAFITQEKCSIRAYTRGDQYRQAFALIRECMGLEALKGPSWAPAKRKGPAKAKAKAKPDAVAPVAPVAPVVGDAVDLDITDLIKSVCAAITGGLVTSDEIEALEIAISLYRSSVVAPVVADATVVH